MVEEFSVDRNYVRSDGKNSPIVREVREIWLDGLTRVSARDYQRMVFVERYMGDRIEAWVSVIDFCEDRETEVIRYNAQMLQSIEFKPSIPECRL